MGAAPSESWLRAGPGQPHARLRRRSRPGLIRGCYTPCGTATTARWLPFPTDSAGDIRVAAVKIGCAGVRVACDAGPVCAHVPLWASAARCGPPALRAAAKAPPGRESPATRHRLVSHVIIRHDALDWRRSRRSREATRLRLHHDGRAQRPASACTEAHRFSRTYGVSDQGSGPPEPGPGQNARSLPALASQTAGDPGPADSGVRASAGRLPGRASWREEQQAPGLHTWSRTSQSELASARPAAGAGPCAARPPQCSHAACGASSRPLHACPGPGRLLRPPRASVRRTGRRAVRRAGPGLGSSCKKNIRT